MPATATVPRITGYLICRNNDAGHPVVVERHQTRTPLVRNVESRKYDRLFVIVESASDDGLSYTADGHEYEAPIGR